MYVRSRSAEHHPVLGRLQEVNLSVRDYGGLPSMAAPCFVDLVEYRLLCNERAV